MMNNSTKDNSISGPPLESTSATSNTILLITGGLLLISFSLLTYISPDFSADFSELEKPVLPLVAILVFSGVVFLFAVFKFHDAKLNNNQLIWIIAIGIILRVLMLFTAPILEDDYYRYLWDGAVTANRINPYKYSPEEVLNGKDVPPELTELANESGNIIHDINHPALRTIYPPVAQAFFALSYWLDAWSLTTWKIILIIMDLATLSLIFNALGVLKLPSSFLLLYWWNPLLIKEIFNSGHFDVLVFPFVLSALITATQSKYLRSTFSIIVGLGIKLWPAFLLPVIIRPTLSKPKQLLSILLLAAVSIGVMFLPVYYSGFDGSSGFIAYGQSWQNNDSIFRIILYLSEAGLNILGIDAFYKYNAARYLVIALISVWILYVSFGNTFKNKDLFSKSLYIIAFAFFVSPTQFPWYYTWLIPLLAIRPNFSLLLLTVLMPLYYLRYYFEPRGELEIFTNIVIWIEYVPVWVLLIWEWRRGNLLKISSG